MATGGDGRRRVARPAFLRHFCKNIASRRRFPCALLYIMQTETTFSCKFSCVPGFRGVPSVLIAGVRRPRRCGGRCLADGQGVALLPLRLPPVSAPVAVGPEHWPRGDSSPLLPPPLFFGGDGRPLVVAALLWCSPSPAVLLGALALGSSLLGVVIYGSIFKCFQPRPQLTRAHAWGLAMLFPAPLPSAGPLAAF